MYRCFFGNYVIDPCWAADYNSTPTRTVLCMPLPWSRDVVRLDTNGLPRPSGPVGHDLGSPWGVQLASGEKCGAVQPDREYRGRVVDHLCDMKSRLVLLGRIHRSREPWAFDSAIATGRGTSRDRPSPCASPGTADPRRPDELVDPPPDPGRACQHAKSSADHNADVRGDALSTAGRTGPGNCFSDLSDRPRIPRFDDLARTLVLLAHPASR